MNSLVIIEHKDSKMHRMSREAIVGAQKIGGQITALVIGKEYEEVANELLNYEIEKTIVVDHDLVPAYNTDCLLYTSPSPRDRQKSRMPSSA